MPEVSQSPASAPVAYRRFPGTGTHILNRVRLYFAPDHLLHVTTTGYSEVYRRFFFRDIQAISLYKTVTGTIWNIVWGGLLFLSIGAAVPFLPESLPGLFPFVILVAVPLIINIARGPTCACYIQTAVQQQRLHSLNRVRRARRLIERIKPLLASAQTPPATATDASIPEAPSPAASATSETPAAFMPPGSTS